MKNGSDKCPPILYGSVKESNCDYFLKKDFLKNTHAFYKGANYIF